MDIHRFLEDAGLGFASYALIAQGRVESFLAAKPLERRALIEEAAQVTGYKTKRRNAEMKLQLTEQNLIRINDIIAEVERRLRSLKRQAAKARRYKRLKEEFREIQKQRFAVESDTVHKSLEALSQQLTAVAQEEQTTLADLRQCEEAVSELNGRRERLETELSDLQEQEVSTRLELDRTRNSAEYHKDQIVQTIDMLRQNADEKDALQAALVRLRDEERSLDTEKMGLQQEQERLHQQITSRADQVQQYSRQLGTAEERLEELRARLLRESAEAAALRNLQDQCEHRRRQLKGERERVSSEQKNALSRLKEWQRKSEAMSQALSSLATKERELKESLEERSARREESNSRLQDIESQEARGKDRLIGLRERLHSLEELELTRSQYSEGVQKGLRHLSRSRAVNMAGTFADCIETSPEFERVVEEFLDEELEYILVDDLDEALRGLQELRSAAAGKCTFLTLNSTNGFGNNGNGHGTPGPEATEGVYGRLADVVKMKPEVEAAFFRVLPEHAQAVVVSDLNKAVDLAHAFPESTFITLEGEALTPRGLLSTSSHGPSKLGLLGLRRQKTRLVKEVASLEKSQRQVLATKEKVKGALSELDRACERLRHQQSRLEKDVIHCEHELEQSEQAVVRQDRTLNMFETEINQILAESRQLKDRHEATVADLSSKDKARVEIEDELKQERGVLHTLRSSLEKAQTTLSNLEGDRKALNERYSAADQASIRLRSQQAESEARLDEICVREEKGHERKADLEREVAVLEERRSRLAENEAGIAERLVRARESYTALKSAIASYNDDLEQFRSEHGGIRDKLSELKVEKARLETQLHNLEKHSKESLRMPLAEAIAGVDLESLDLALVSAEYERLAAVLDSFGPINMTALNEYQENEERFEFLTQQRRDIELAITDITAAIQEMNRRSQVRFSLAFEAINNNFRQVFQRLFGGGSCGMELLDDEDILECGIDVFAQPPGKRLQNVMLLSGGEKALTVFALLMGIFMFRPSRFCVLDEVDAPLDDANIGRFSELIHQMGEQTQFVVITHNKRTMQSADALYGITMEEEGVSKVVSVRFELGERAQA
jgi:chromosome segregation protein